MSVSIYYTAKRNTPLTQEETIAIQRIVKENDVGAQVKAYWETGQGYNWETFTIYNPNNPTAVDVIFEGATKLPDNTSDASIIGLEHWLKVLTQIRRAIRNASWHVHVDDTDIPWNEASQAFDMGL
jgi:hypothetical protein